MKSNLQETPVLFSKITGQSYDQSVAVYVRNKFVDLLNCSSSCDEHRSRDDRRIIIRRHVDKAIIINTFGNEYAA